MAIQLKDDGTTRGWLAEIFAAGGFLVILVLAGIVIVKQPGESQHVMNAIVPLIASWVGTVIAYYFSKENLAAATSSVATLAKGMLDMGGLQNVTVKEKMIPRASIATLPVKMTQPLANLDTTSWKSIVDYATSSATPLTRLPIFREDGTIVYLIHISLVNQALAAGAMHGTDVTTITVKDFLGDPKVHAIATGSFALVSPGLTLDQAKAKMDQVPNCEDAFVTDDGTAAKPVVGWITDDVVWAAARV